MFITNPGRMGDEDGCTFIIKKDNTFIGYRVEHWMYDIEECTVNESDVTKVFPKWRETWSKGNSEKYKYYYMGFGNGLCVDKSIVNIFENYLESCINERKVGSLMYFFLMSAIIWY